MGEVSAVKTGGESDNLQVIHMRVYTPVRMVSYAKLIREEKNPVVSE
jgi:hypothetical protein